MVQILPYAEQADTFDTIASFSSVNGVPFASYKQLIDRVNGKNGQIDDNTVDRTVVPWAVCPARATNGVNEKRGQCTYRGNAGSSSLLDDGAMKHRSSTDGRGYSLGQFSDGLSNTYLAWERNDDSQFKYGGSGDGNITPFYAGRVFSVGVYRYTNATNPDPAAELTLASPYSAGPAPYSGYSGPGPNSDHPGSVFGALMADGAVRFDSLKITNGVFRALSTRAGGEPAP